MDYFKAGDKELPRVGHQLASCSLVISYVLMFTRMHLDINNPFRIDLDPFRMILTLISVANAYIIRYLYHPNKPADLWECRVLGGGRGRQ